MATLLAVYNSKGCVGRCDFRCYAAIGKMCHCICGGRNHGVGEAQARENVAAGIGLDGAALFSFVCLHDELNTDDTTVIDRTVVPDSRAARQLAYLRLNQLELSFEG